MPIDDRLRDMFAELSQLREAQRPERSGLSGGDGGGTSDGMNQRVDRLERNADLLARDLADLRVGLATLTERVAHLPSKGFIVTASSGTIVLLTAAIVFADKLRALI